MELFYLLRLTLLCSRSQRFLADVCRIGRYMFFFRCCMRFCTSSNTIHERKIVIPFARCGTWIPGCSLKKHHSCTIFIQSNSLSFNRWNNIFIANPLSETICGSELMSTNTHIYVIRHHFSYFNLFLGSWFASYTFGIKWEERNNRQVRSEQNFSHPKNGDFPRIIRWSKSMSLIDPRTSSASTSKNRTLLKLKNITIPRNGEKSICQ